MLLRNTVDDTIWVLQTERLEQVRPQLRPEPDACRQGYAILGQPPVAPCSQPAFSRRRSRCSCRRGCAHKQWRSGVVMIQGTRMLLHPGSALALFAPAATCGTLLVPLQMALTRLLAVSPACCPCHTPPCCAVLCCAVSLCAGRPV